MKEFLPILVTVGVTLVVGLIFGATVMQHSFEKDCERMGKTRIENIVYSCRRETP
jgi:uncharacterized protein YneF (UPF0154 family)